MSLHRKASELRRGDYVEIGTRLYKVIAYLRFVNDNHNGDPVERRALLCELMRSAMSEPIRQWFDVDPDHEVRVCHISPGMV